MKFADIYLYFFAFIWDDEIELFQNMELTGFGMRSLWNYSCNLLPAVGTNFWRSLLLSGTTQNIAMVTTFTMLHIDYLWFKLFFNYCTIFRLLLSIEMTIMSMYISFCFCYFSHFLIYKFKEVGFIYIYIYNEN